MKKKYENIYSLLRELLDSQLALNEEQTKLFCSKYKVIETKRNEILLQPGQVCPSLYFVNKGGLRIYLTNLKGHEATSYLVMKGRQGTAFPSFILQEPSLAYIQSIGPSELLCITFKDFRELFDTIPGYGQLYLNNLELDYIASIKRIESLITLDAKDRYNMLIKDDPEMIQRLPTRIIADYLGISQETLSRLKSKSKINDICH